MGPDGPWEVGLYPAKDGNGFLVGFDTYGRPGHRLTELVGVGGARLKQEYAAVMALRKAKRLALQGFTVKQERVGSRIKIRLTR